MAEQTGREPKLRKKLIKEMRRRVKERLGDVYVAQELINTKMKMAPDAVEGNGARGGTFFLMPQPKQRVKTFADTRWREVENEKNRSRIRLTMRHLMASC